MKKETYLGAIADDDYCILLEPKSMYLFKEELEAIKGKRVRVRSKCTSYSFVYFSEEDIKTFSRSKYRGVREIDKMAVIHADSKVLWEDTNTET